MNREDLENFKTEKEWYRARIKFYEEQKSLINRLSSTISDMPKGSPTVQDNEAETLVKLMDTIDKLIIELTKKSIDIEQKAMTELAELKPQHRLMLYYFYILNKSMNYIIKEVPSLKYEKKYAYKLKEEALHELDLIYHDKKG